jgi:nucleoid-associated protein YgaU
MERKKVVLLAAGVLIAGICCALPFRRASRPSSPGPVAPAADAPILAAAALPATDANFPSLTVSAEPPSSEKPEVQAEPAPPIVAAGSEKFDSPPLDGTPPAAPEPVASQPASNLSLATVAPALASTDAPPRPQSWRRHRIKDGDTLAKLAQRYLGDPAREAEIYALNREVLPDPAILPIGAWLRIPASE